MDTGSDLENAQDRYYQLSSSQGLLVTSRELGTLYNGINVLILNFLFSIIHCVELDKEQEVGKDCQEALVQPKIHKFLTFKIISTVASSIVDCSWNSHECECESHKHCWRLGCVFA